MRGSRRRMTAGSLQAPRLPTEALILAGVFLYLLVFTVLPLGRLLLEALGPDAQGTPLGILRGQWESRATMRALVNTLQVSALATLVSVLIGGAFALLSTLTDIRGKTALTFVLLLPLLVPPQITTLAWIELTGPQSFFLGPLGLAPAPGTTNPLYSMQGIVLVMGIEHATLVFLTLQAGLRALPQDLVEAARIAGLSPMAIVRRIVLPLAAPALGAGAALAFVSAIWRGAPICSSCDRAGRCVPSSSDAPAFPSRSPRGRRSQCCRCCRSARCWPRR
jgi:iron(III) transport system permease protein